MGGCGGLPQVTFPLSPGGGGRVESDLVARGEAAWADIRSHSAAINACLDTLEQRSFFGLYVIMVGGPAAVSCLLL